MTGTSSSQLGLLFISRNLDLDTSICEVVVEKYFVSSHGRACLFGIPKEIQHVTLFHNFNKAKDKECSGLLEVFNNNFVQLSSRSNCSIDIRLVLKTAGHTRIEKYVPLSSKKSCKRSPPITREILDKKADQKMS